jgi:hypothetical protein
MVFAAKGRRERRGQDKEIYMKIKIKHPRFSVLCSLRPFVAKRFEAPSVFIRESRGKFESPNRRP